MPSWFIDIGGICVPKKRVVRKSLNYQSLFAGDNAMHNVPDDIDVQGASDDIDVQGTSDDNAYNQEDQTAGDNVFDNTFSKHGEGGVYTISNDGVIMLQYDNGFVEYIQPDQYAEFLANGQYVFTEKIIDVLMPYMTPEIEEEIHEEGTQDKLNEETEVLGADNYSLISSF